MFAISVAQSLEPNQEKRERDRVVSLHKPQNSAISWQINRGVQRSGWMLILVVQPFS